MTAVNDARLQVDVAIRACCVQAVAVFVFFQWGVTPAVRRWPALAVITAVAGVMGIWWAWSYARRWRRHLEWLDTYALAEEAGEAITLLGLLSSPDATRPPVWPRFWWRWWGVKL